MKKTTLSTLIAGVLLAPAIVNAASSELAFTVKFSGASPACTVGVDTIVVAVQSTNLAGFIPARGWSASVSANDGLTQFKIALPAGKTAICQPGVNGDSVEVRFGDVAEQTKMDPKTNTAKVVAVEKKYGPANEWAVPSSPAFDIIGVTPNLASLPKTPRDIAMHLVGGRAADGTIQKGLAIDVSISQIIKVLPLISPDLVEAATMPKSKPVANILEIALEGLFPNTFKAENRTLENRLADRLKLSFATTQEENSASAPVNLGIGLQYVLWDYSDRKTDCNPAKKVSAKAGDQASENCSKATESDEDDLFAKTASAIGVANAYALKDGKWGNRELGTKGRWITVASGGLPFPQILRTGTAKVQFIAHYRRFDNQPIPVDKPTAGQTATAPIAAKKQDTSTTALRLKIGQPSGAASFEFARTNKQPLGGISERVSRRAYGVEWKVAKDIWLVASAGREWGSSGVTKNQPFVVTTLRFGDKAVPLRASE